MVDSEIVRVYSQAGEGLPFFVGKQYGSGWLRTLARVAFPILKKVGQVALNTAKDVVADKRPILPSLVKNVASELKRPASSPGRRIVRKRQRRRYPCSSATQL